MKIAYLGDSITDKVHVGTEKNYWQFLEEMIGAEPVVYGINGHQWRDIPGQIDNLLSDYPAGTGLDIVMIFAGTNDFNASVPLGEWFRYEEGEVEVSGRVMVRRKRRFFVYDDSTFCGRINIALSKVKHTLPDTRVIILTPIHRGYAIFGDDNIQPDESWPNAAGLYIDSYVSALKEAANLWAVPVLDLNSLSGLYPVEDSNSKFFHNAATDRLHPGALGHLRIAQIIASAIAPASLR